MQNHANEQRDFTCIQEPDVSMLKEKVAKIDKTLYFGNGEPSVIVQLATQRQTVSAITRLAWITLAAVIGQLAYLFFQGVGIR